MQFLKLDSKDLDKCDYAKQHPTECQKKSDAEQCIYSVQQSVVIQIGGIIEAVIDLCNWADD